MKRDVITVLTLVIIAIVVIGEVIVYTSGTDDFNISVEQDGNELGYSISVKGSQVYSVVVMDNDNMLPMSEVYIYYDKNYATYYKHDTGAVGSSTFTHEYYIDQLIRLIENRSGMTVRIISATELEAAMDDDIGTAFQKGLVVISGALPDTVYTGNSTDKIFDWMDDGGRLYWAGNLVGAFYATTTSIESVPDGYQSLFFGSDCLNTTDASFVDKDDDSNTLRYDLSLKNNDVRFSVDVSALPVGKKHLTMGFTNGTYSSIAMMEYGKGMICVLGGDLKKTQCDDMAKMISSNVVHSTKVIDAVTGDIRFGKATGTVDVTGFTGNISVYVYLGGYFQVYGRHFSFA